MNCESVQRLMYEAVDRTLSSDERRLVDAHLPGCVHCKSELAVLNALIETVETTPPVQPSDAFLSDVMDSLPAPERSTWFVPSLVFPRVVFAVMLAAAALVWLYRATLAEYVGSLVPVQDAVGPLATAIRDLQAFMQSHAGAVVSRLPEPVSTSVDWGSLLLVVTTLVVGYVLVRTAETLEVGDSNFQVGKRP